MAATRKNTSFSAFECGNKFSSYSEFESAKEQYENLTFTVLVKVQTAKLPENHKYKESLLYKYIVFDCKKGNIRAKSVAKGIRPNAKSNKLGCPFKLKLSTSNGFLVVKESNLNHANHELSEEKFQYLPEKLRLNEDERKEVEIALQLGEDKKRIQERLIKKRGGRPVLLKSLHNVSLQMKQNKKVICPKLKEVNEIARNISTLICTLPLDRFDYYFEKLKDFHALLLEEKSFNALDYLVTAYEIMEERTKTSQDLDCLDTSGSSDKNESSCKLSSLKVSRCKKNQGKANSHWYIQKTKKRKKAEVDTFASKRPEKAISDDNS